MRYGLKHKPRPLRYDQYRWTWHPVCSAPKHAHTHTQTCAHIHTRTTKSHTPTFVAAVMSHRHTVWKKNNKIASLMATLIIHVIIGCTQQVTLERGAPRQPIAVQKTSSETGFDRFSPQLTLPSCVPSASVQASPHPHYLRRKHTHTQYTYTQCKYVYSIV